MSNNSQKTWPRIESDTLGVVGYRVGVPMPVTGLLGTFSGKL